MQAMYKSDLAARAGVSTRTLQRWLDPLKGELKALGVTEKTRLLNASAVRLICERFAIEA